MFPHVGLSLLQIWRSIRTRQAFFLRVKFIQQLNSLILALSININDSIFKHEPHIITIEQRTFHLGSNNGKHAYLVCKGIVQYLGCQIVLKFHSLPPSFTSKPNIHCLDNLSAIDIIIQHTSHLEGLILK